MLHSCCRGPHVHTIKSIFHPACRSSSRIPSCLSDLQTNTCLTSLVLSSINTTEYAEDIAEIVRHNKTLLHLAISTFRVPAITVDVRTVLRPLHQNTTLQSIELSVACNEDNVPANIGDFDIEDVPAYMKTRYRDFNDDSRVTWKRHSNIWDSIVRTITFPLYSMIGASHQWVHVVTIICCIYNYKGVIQENLWRETNKGQKSACSRGWSGAAAP